MWYFVSPQIIFGDNALDALDELSGTRCLVVTDKVVYDLGLVDQVTSHLSQAGLPFEIFSQVEPDPSIDTVQKGAAKALEYQPDWIIGVGGGSVLDAAKAIWVLYERPDLHPAEITPVADKLDLRRKARLITIPTTSGTGAEVTWAIVLTDTAAKRKLGLGHRENVADIAILDPDMVMGMPPRLTAATGLDALTHAIEGYTCNWHSDMTDGLCLQAAQEIFTYLPRAYVDGDDREAREKMHNAAALAGLGFGNAMASIAHALGHTLGALYHIPHGVAVGLFLPYTLEYIAAENADRIAVLARALNLRGENNESLARILAQRIRDLRMELDESESIAHLGIDQGEYTASLETLVDNAFNDSSMITTPRMPDYVELRKIFIYAFHGTPIDF